MGMKLLTISLLVVVLSCGVVTAEAQAIFLPEPMLEWQRQSTSSTHSIEAISSDGSFLIATVVRSGSDLTLIHGIEADTGTLRWRRVFSTDNESVVSGQVEVGRTDAVGDYLVYTVTDSVATMSPTCRAVALAVKTGDLLWEFQVDAQGSCVGSPIVSPSGNHVIVVHQDGRFTVLDSVRGSVVASYPLDDEDDTVRVTEVLWNANGLSVFVTDETGAIAKWQIATMVEPPSLSPTTLPTDNQPPPTASPSLPSETRTTLPSMVPMVPTENPTSAPSTATSSPTCKDNPGVEITPDLRLRYLSTITDEQTGNGTLTVDVTYNGIGWIGVGWSQNGGQRMVPGEAVIGNPDGVRKWRLVGYSLDGVLAFPPARQTLLSARFIQNETHSILRFTKILQEEGEIPILGNGENTILWAYGRSNVLGYHAGRGILDLTLTPCLDDDAAVPPENLLPKGRKAGPFRRPKHQGGQA